MVDGKIQQWGDQMVENGDFFDMVNRMITAAGKRTGKGDEFELREMVLLKQNVETQLRNAVHAQIRDGKSWADIGFALGMTRQAAFKRFK